MLIRTKLHDGSNVHFAVKNFRTNPVNSACVVKNFPLLDIRRLD